MINHKELWSEVKKSVTSKNLSNKRLQAWFEPTNLIEINEDPKGSAFRLGVPTELHKYWISQHLLESISAEISATFKSPFRLELVVTGESKGPVLEENLNLLGPEESPQKPITPTEKPKRSISVDGLNKDYSFSTFVVGRNNEFAHAASFNISENPGGDNYNPLFICGPTGMGKTHLLNAVGNNIMERFQHLRIKYVSAERFLNECVSSIRRNEMDKFRHKYRQTSDVLLMDDIQILKRGEVVQEEFFNTLNDFFDKGQQVIVASDRMPKDINGLEDRIRTRLEWGLIADIQMPDLETRVAILKYKAEKRGINLPSGVVTYTAKISKRSIRELEGNLNKIKMFSELQGLPISLELAKKVLATHDDTTAMTVEGIQKLVCNMYNVRIIDLKSKSRTKPLVIARQVAMFLVKKHIDKSLVDIGRAFGGRDHTTVINALHRVEDQQTKDSDLKKNIEELESRIHNITGV